MWIISKKRTYEKFFFFFVSDSINVYLNVEMVTKKKLWIRKNSPKLCSFFFLPKKKEENMKDFYGFFESLIVSLFLPLLIYSFYSQFCSVRLYASWFAMICNWKKIKQNTSAASEHLCSFLAVSLCCRFSSATATFSTASWFPQSSIWNY